MRHAYFVLSLAIVVLGAVHIAAAPRYFAELTAAAVWFASGGLAMILTGALNLLRRAYGAAAPGLRAVCVSANLAMTAFALLAGYASRATALEVVLVLGVLGGTTLLSTPLGGTEAGPDGADLTDDLCTAMEMPHQHD